MDKIELQVVGRRFEDFFVRNKGSKDKHEQVLIKKQLDENQDIISNLGVNPRELLKEWKRKLEICDALGDIIGQVNDLLLEKKLNEEILKQLREEHKKLEEKLRKYEILQYTLNELGIELGKGIINKLKLDKMLMNLDKTFRTRALNYKKDGCHEVYENTMSLYRIISGREV